MIVPILQGIFRSYSVKNILISNVDTLFQVSRQSFYNIELDYIRMHELSVVYGSFLLFPLLNPWKLDLTFEKKEERKKKGKTKLEYTFEKVRRKGKRNFDHRCFRKNNNNLANHRRRVFF